MNFNPAQLPEIDAIDVVDIRRIEANNVGNYMREAIDAPYAHLTDESAQQIASLWRELPSGEQSRCHIPPFGLRFYSNGKLQLQASICWECDNIFGDSKGDDIWFAFDAQSETAQKLLSLCKQAVDAT